jgi:protein-tyrosine phosphatase
MMDVKQRRGSRSYKEIMIGMYHSLIRDLMPAYSLFFTILADTAKTPLLFHCAAGKDRTGVAAALFLSALGVERSTVYADYVLSASLLEERFSPLVKAHPEFRDMVTVKREYLEASFGVIDDEWGGVESYLAEKLGVNSAALREFYTEPDRSS